VDLRFSPLNIQKPKPTPEPASSPGDIYVNDIIEFGGYDWIVLDIADGNILVVSEKILESRPYHRVYGVTTWAQSDIRRYLNGEFFNRFSETERAMIAETEVINNDNPWYDLDNPFYEEHPEYKPLGGDDTVDRIFLLSLDEVVKYFGDSGKLSRGPSDRETFWFDDQYNERRLAQHAAGVTGYIEQYSEMLDIKAGQLWAWWLRSPGGGSAAYVGVGGDISFEFPGDYDIYIPFVGVRPAMWLNLP